MTILFSESTGISKKVFLNTQTQHKRLVIFFKYYNYLYNIVTAIIGS